MRHRVELSIGIAAVAAAALLTAACGDSGSPTEPPLLAPTPTQSPAIAGGWTGTYSGVTHPCETAVDATFDENRGSVTGTINVSEPCWNMFLFQGTFQGNTLEGEFTDYDGFHNRGRGTVSGGTLEIHLDGDLGGIRMNLHR
jgi:opacity protein-like surface antigen